MWLLSPPLTTLIYLCPPSKTVSEASGQPSTCEGFGSMNTAVGKMGGEIFFLSLLFEKIYWDIYSYVCSIL